MGWWEVWCGLGWVGGLGEVDERVWCGTVWCDVVWCVAWCGVVWRGKEMG